MKRAIYISAFFLVGLALRSQVMWQFNKDTVITWYYQEGDEFTEPQLKTSYWDYVSHSRSLFANREQQYYTDGQNHILNNGILQLTAKKETVVRKTIDWMDENDSLFSGGKFFHINKAKFNYTAGQLVSKKEFNKGFYECRFRLPAQSGYWPAFWLYGGSPNEEIDVMECKTELPKQIHVDTHCGNKCDYIRLPLQLQKQSYGGWLKTACDFTKEFNVVACAWDENDVRFYLNGECIGISKVKFDVKKHLVLNIAVPGEKGPFNPPPLKNDSSVAHFEIDYVRIWTKENRRELRNNVTFPIISEDTIRTLVTQSIQKKKRKLVYGKKSDHLNDGVLITFLETKNGIQLYSQGVFPNESPGYKILSLSGQELVQGKVQKRMQIIEKSGLKSGVYLFEILCNGLSAKTKIKVH